MPRSSRIEDIIDQVRNGTKPYELYSMYSSEKKKYKTLYPDVQFTAVEPQKPHGKTCYLIKMK